MTWRFFKASLNLSSKYVKSTRLTLHVIPKSKVTEGLSTCGGQL